MSTTLTSYQTCSDEDLMQALVGKQASALDALHRRYRTVLRSVITRVLHDESDVDDVLQEVFLQVWNRARSYSARKGKLLSWLCTLARRRAIDRLRQHTAYRRATDRFEISSNHPDKEMDEIHTVERDACRDELRSLLQHHLHNLPPNQEQVIRMAFLESRSQREIASLTRTPLGTVKTRIELGIRKLTHALQGLRGEM